MLDRFRTAVGRWMAKTGLRLASSGLTNFAASQHSRLTMDWIQRPLSGDQEIQHDMSVLRRRAREQIRNNGHARRFINMMKRNVIGPYGIRLQAQIERPDGTLDLEINRRIERAWRRWCEPGHCTTDRRWGFVDVQHQLVAALAGDGEVLIRLHPAFENDFGFALELIDADMLDQDFHRPRGRGLNEVRFGIEVDAWGAPLAYHVWNRHPADHFRDSLVRRRIPATEIIHHYVPLRVNQSRGVTWFAPILLDSKMLGGYREAELVAARTAAAKMGFITRSESNSDFVPPGPEDARQTMDASPGTIETLSWGEKFEAWDPSHPNSAYGDFEKAVLRTICAGLDVSYSTLTSDLSDANYSSMRSGLLEERDAWKLLQGFVVRHVHRRVYREWLKYALLTGQLELPSVDAQEYWDVTWMPRGWDWVDPLKEVQGSVLAVDAGFESRTAIAAARGRDFEEILKERQREEELAAELGVSLKAELPSGGTDGQTDGDGESGNARARARDTRGGDRAGPDPGFRRNGNGGRPGAGAHHDGHPDPATHVGRNRIR